ncbi:hypothetical protein [Oscillibacter sp.]|uniref:hypothetical protein n=1 Tax=Oscillibacter sp. TaxID=1945593 RepID=UPI002D7FB4B3|nr:hypothetical protein [Oscillibacter sp.]
MKKSSLWTGLVMIALGTLFLLAALLWDTPLEGLLFGMFGAFAAPGIVQVIKYVKWSSPKNAPLYRERLEQEQIDLQDERKSMLRDRSGRYAYILGLLVAALAMLVFSVLDAFGIVGEDSAALMVLFLGGYAVFQLVAGWVIYKRLEKRY